MEYTKFDMHCHTHEGSPDSEISVADYISELKKKGFGGMLIADHNSYKGYETAMKMPSEEPSFGDNADTSFVVLKGMEYDTGDFGHMLVVLPHGTELKHLKHRGLPLLQLIDEVHRAGGIIGPAHPCGETFLSFQSTGRLIRERFLKKNIWPLFDFAEGYNACEPDENNLLARKYAGRYMLPMTGGSDAHWRKAIGRGYAYLPKNIKSEDDLIDYIRSSPDIRIGGKKFNGTTKDKLGKANKLLVYGFYFYNKFEVLFHLPGRINVIRKDRKG